MLEKIFEIVQARGAANLKLAHLVEVIKDTPEFSRWLLKKRLDPERQKTKIAAYIGTAEYKQLTKNAGFSDSHDPDDVISIVQKVSLTKDEERIINLQNSVSDILGDIESITQNIAESKQSVSDDFENIRNVNEQLTIDLAAVKTELEKKKDK